MAKGSKFIVRHAASRPVIKESRDAQDGPECDAALAQKEKSARNMGKIFAAGDARIAALSFELQFATGQERERIQSELRGFEGAMEALGRKRWLN